MYQRVKIYQKKSELNRFCNLILLFFYPLFLGEKRKGQKITNFRTFSDPKFIYHIKVYIVAWLNLALLNMMTLSQVNLNKKRAASLVKAYQKYINFICLTVSTFFLSLRDRYPGKILYKIGDRLCLTSCYHLAREHTCDLKIFKTYFI